jgi:hypothetical protein
MEGNTLFNKRHFFLKDGHLLVRCGPALLDLTRYQNEGVFEPTRQPGEHKRERYRVVRLSRRLSRGVRLVSGLLHRLAYIIR